MKQVHMYMFLDRHEDETKVISLY